MKMGWKGKVSILSQRTENRFDLMYANGDIDEIDNILAKRQTGHGGVFFASQYFQIHEKLGINWTQTKIRDNVRDKNRIFEPRTVWMVGITLSKPANLTVFNSKFTIFFHLNFYITVNWGYECNKLSDESNL